ncbi:pickpocket protein 19-like [Chelonus insularis]|uniref:pickpocket protein 19-like n=1 Tax=Chelonus insularis TaxID=460826 RepID=UPI00158DF445|nr:pickpocket protein 19-like [Chelonus insularis]XP_034944558.1 pickpocket protein 19-like [Chelonus insularis]
MTNNDFNIGKPKLHKFEPLKVDYMNKFINEAKLKSNFTPPPSLTLSPKDTTRSKSSFKKYLVEYASASTVHGLNHLIAPRRHIFEKLLVAFFIIGSLVILIILSIDFWDRYQNYPTVIVLDHEYRSFNVTKPGIVVCPNQRVHEEYYPSVFEKYGVKDTEEARSFFNFLSTASYETFSQVPDFNEVDPKLWLFILFDLKPDVKYVFEEEKAVWLVTERGVCLTFNNYVAPYSTPDYWKANNWTVIPVPDLPVYTYQTREIFDSIKIITHDVEFSPIYPGSILNLDDKFYLSYRKTLKSVTLSVAEITSSQQVKDLSLTQRKCKLFEEGGLKMWPIYTYTMCASECRYQQVYKICKCYPYFARPMPDIPVCNVSQLKCIGEHLNEIVLPREVIIKKCNCWPDCDMAKYMEESISGIALKEGSPPEALLNIVTSFPTDKFKRELLFGFNDFLASVGGGAGLFLGASVISFIEILYFATLRLFWYKVKLYQENKKKRKVASAIVN